MASNRRHVFKFVLLISALAAVSPAIAEVTESNLGVIVGTAIPTISEQADSSKIAQASGSSEAVSPERVRAVYEEIKQRCSTSRASTFTPPTPRPVAAPASTQTQPAKPVRALW